MDIKPKDRTGLAIFIVVLLIILAIGMTVFIAVKFLSNYSESTESDSSKLPVESVDIQSSENESDPKIQTKKEFTLKPSYTTEGFAVKYYNDSDKKTLLGEETKKFISLMVAYGGPFNIASENLYVTWEGELDFAENVVQSISVSQSWASSKIMIDDKVVYSGDRDKLLNYTFTKGKHKIRVEHENNWHTDDFQVKIMNPIEPMSVFKVSSNLKNVINEDTQVYLIGFYESSAEDHSIDIEFEKTDKPVVLFLDSYSPIIWNIVNLNETKIEAVVVNSFGEASSVYDESNENLPVYYCDEMPFAYVNRDGGVDKDSENQSESIVEFIEKVSSKKIAGMYGSYNGVSIKIPAVSGVPAVVHQQE